MTRVLEAECGLSLLMLQNEWLRVRNPNRYAPKVRAGTKEIYRWPAHR